jgi:hypothetical protein
MVKPKKGTAAQSKQQVPNQWNGSSRSRRATLTYHRIKCNVCTHPDRQAIDEAFLRWESPETLVTKFGIAHRSSIYRHAHATGLYAKRRRKLSSSLEFIIEHAGHVVPTAGEFFRAVKEYAQLGDEGQRVVPSKPRIITLVSDSRSETPSQDKPINRNIAGIESDATH